MGTTRGIARYCEGYPQVVIVRILPEIAWTCQERRQDFDGGRKDCQVAGVIVRIARVIVRISGVIVRISP